MKTKRKLASVIVGLVGWFAVATVCDRLLRVAWPEYAAAVATFAFSMGMLFARLAIGAGSTIAAGLAVGWLARGHRPTAVALGALLLLVFVPEHVMLWAKFPVWYHLVFLGSLIPLTMLGARGPTAARSTGEDSAARTA
jgi:hypothetical protein